MIMRLSIREQAPCDASNLLDLHDKLMNFPNYPAGQPLLLEKTGYCGRQLSKKCIMVCAS